MHMTEEEAKAWVKDKTNQKKVIEEFFARDKPRSAKVAFFMAGIPGAGKTEFTQNALKEVSSGLISIEHDELVEYIDGYKPENYYNFRKAGSALVTRIFDECLKNGYAFIFDGTLSSENGIRNINKCFKHEYSVVVVYILQDVKMAWGLTQARELVKKRAIEKSGFIETCTKINQNLLGIFNAHKTNPKFSFWIINKQGQTDLSKASAVFHGSELDKADEIEKVLRASYTINVAEL
jgi:predicted ABC-type ATPase